MNLVVARPKKLTSSLNLCSIFGTQIKGTPHPFSTLLKLVTLAFPKLFGLKFLKFEEGNANGIKTSVFGNENGSQSHQFNFKDKKHLGQIGNYLFGSILK